MAVEVAEAYVSIIPSARGFGAALASETDGAASSAGSSAGGLFSSGLLGVIKANAGKLAVAAAGVLTIGGAVELGKSIFNIGAMFDDAFDKIRVTTGKTGAELGSLEGSFKTVFANVPTNAEDASSAIATLNQKLGLSGQPLEGLATQLLNLSHITGTDLQSNMSAAVDVFNSFGISAADQPAKLDELYRASQATGVGVADLASSMANAGPNLQQLGLSFEQSAGLVAIFGKAGVDVSAVLPALSKTIVSAAKDGKNAGDVFRETFDAIKNAPDDTSAAGAAIDVFGARAGPKLAGLIRQGKLGYEELAAAIGSGGDTINTAAADTADFGEKWNVFKNKILVGLEPVASKVFGAVGDAMTAIGPKVGPIIDSISAGFASFFAAIGQVDFSGFFGTLADEAGKVFDALKGIDFKAVFAGVVEFITPIADAIGKLATSGFDLLSESLKTIGKLFEDNRATIETLAGIIQGALVGAITAAAAIFGFLADHMGLVKAVIIPLIAAFAAYQIVVGVITIATTIWTAAQAALNVVMALNPIGLVVAAIAALVVGVIYAYTHFETFRNIVDGFWQAIQAVFNWVVSNWQLIGAILFAPIGIAVLLIVRNWDTIKGAFEAMYNFIFDHWQLIVSILTGPIGIAVGIILTHWDIIKAGFSAVVDFISSAISAVASFISGVVSAIVGFFSAGWSAILSVVSDVWQAIQAGIGAVAGVISSYVSAIISIWSSAASIIWSVVSTAWDNISSGVSTIVGAVSGAVSGVIGLFSSMAGSVISVAQGAWSVISSGVHGIVDAVSGVVSTIVGLFSGISSAIGNPFAGVVGAVQGAIGAIRSAWNSTIGGFGIHIPSVLGFGGADFTVPSMAVGGIVTKPTFALIGEAGPEAVVPLRTLNHMDISDASSTGAGTVVNAQINAQTNASPEMIARELSWQMRTAGV